MLSSPSFVLVGAGSRGRMFATWLRENVGEGAVVAIAEPRAEARETVAAMHGIPAERRFETWQELLANPRLADVLINATMDREHAASACAAMRLGYDMLLEKPLATTLEECREIDRVRAETGRIVSVCHSLRYHRVYEQVMEIVASGAIGEIVSLDQLEAVEHIHQAHSFVRGNWANSGRSTFMLLSKSCHDIDIIGAVIPRACLKVSSFGSLTHFRPEHAPEGAPAFCVEGCPAEEACPYHAMKVYGVDGPWRRSAGFSDLSHEETRARLAASPYGRCVYQTDNDVVDHQVVAMEFEGGVTATFTMTAFTPWGGRYLRLHGTRGYLEARIDQGAIDLWEFWHANRHTHHDVPKAEGPHGGADARVMTNLIEAIVQNDPTLVRTGTAESLRTHTIVFAAERARLEGRVVEISDLRPA